MYSWCPSLTFLAHTPFILPTLLQGSLSTEGRDLMETSCLELSVPRSLTRVISFLMLLWTNRNILLVPLLVHQLKIYHTYSFSIFTGIMMLYPLRHCSLITDLKSAESNHAYIAVTACKAVSGEKSAPNKLHIHTHSSIRSC